MNAGTSYAIPVSEFLARAQQIAPQLATMYASAPGVVDAGAGYLVPVVVVTLQSSGRLLFEYGPGSTTNFDAADAKVRQIMQIVDAATAPQLVVASGMSTGLKLALGLGVFALIGGFAYYIARDNDRGR